MSRHATNILANVAARAAAVLIGFAFIPIYTNILGSEAYGLVGFSASLYAVFAVLDMGLGTSINRELARRLGRPDEAQDMRDLTRSFELLYWATAVIICGIVLLLASPIAHRWVQAQILSPQSIETCVRLMGIWLLFQWPISFYSGALMGLDRQVANSTLTTVFGVLRAVGAWLVLKLVAPTVVAFFVWQAVVALLNALAMVVAVWRYSPTGGTPRLRKDLTLSVWRFAAGVASISLVTIFLTELDKTLLSRLRPLSELGFYTIAGAAASLVGYVSGPLYSAFFPSFSNLAGRNDESGLARLYHKSCQLMTVAIVPLTAALVLCAPQLLYLWTRNPVTVTRTTTVVSLLAIGNCINGLLTLPYALQLAYGWTSLTLRINIASVLVLAPSLYLAVERYGTIGAATSWVALNAACFIITIQFLHRRLLPREKWHWYFVDVGLPAVAAVLAAMLARWALPTPASAALVLVVAGAVWCVSLTAAAISAPAMRALAFGWLCALNQHRRSRQPVSLRGSRLNLAATTAVDEPAEPE